MMSDRIEEPEGDEEEYEQVTTIGYAMPGRKPKNPNKKIGKSNRFLSTPPIETLLEKVATEEPYTFQKSDYIRLAVLEQLWRDGLVTMEVLGDPTWDTLRLNPHTNPRLQQMNDELNKTGEAGKK